MPGVLSTLTSTIAEQAIPRKKAPWESMVIPFEKPAPKVVSKENRLSFKVRSNPDQKDSLQYEVITYASGDGPPEEWIYHIKTYWKLVKGQSIDGTEAQFAMLRGLLKGKALSDFKRFYKELSTLEAAAPESVPKILAKMTKEVFPKRALQKQCRAMRRYLRKPNEMSTLASMLD